MLYPPADDGSVAFAATYIGNIDYLRLNVENVAVGSLKALSQAIANRQLQVRSCYIVIVV